MERQTEDFGTVPPDPAENSGDDLTADGDDGAAMDAADDFAVDADDELAVDADDERGAGRAATGEPRVDAALARLDDLGGLPVMEHGAVFEDVHRRLREVLGELDTGQRPGPENRPAR